MKIDEKMSYLLLICGAVTLILIFYVFWSFLDKIVRYSEEGESNLIFYVVFVMCIVGTTVVYIWSGYLLLQEKK